MAELDNYESTNGYNEYHFDLDYEIAHDTYELIFILIACHEGVKTIDKVQVSSQMHFEHYYIVEKRKSPALLSFFGSLWGLPFPGCPCYYFSVVFISPIDSSHELLFIHSILFQIPELTYRVVCHFCGCHDQAAHQNMG